MATLKAQCFSSSSFWLSVGAPSDLNSGSGGAPQFGGPSRARVCRTKPNIIGAVGSGVDGFETIGATGADFGGSKRL